MVVFASRVNESEVGGGEGEEAIASSEGTAKLLREAMEKDGIQGVVELHGGLKPADRLKSMKAFQDGSAKVIIATIESGGTGINLDDTAGDKPRSLIMMTAPFSAVENVQAAGRVWRLKSKSTPRIRYVFGDTDVDEWNSSLISSKMKTLGATVGGEVGKLDVDSPEAAEMGLAGKEPYKWPSLIGRREPELSPSRPAELPRQSEPKPSSPPATQPKSEPTKVSAPTNEVNTARGKRHVHSFSPSEAFWRVWKSSNRPSYVSARKNERTGKWEASVWGDSKEEVAKHLSDLAGRGVHGDYFSTLNDDLDRQLANVERMIAINEILAA